ncbi:hypothetical protein B5X24_HaOG216650 [Helicoverpa armigera]|nr:hypothetical protein B5X24_HaOG216650 [Helicoverpa armigera]
MRSAPANTNGIRIPFSRTIRITPEIKTTTKANRNDSQKNELFGARAFSLATYEGAYFHHRAVDPSGREFPTQCTANLAIN